MKLNITTPGDREVVMTREFDAPRELVFDAWTKPELIRRWLLGPDGWTMPVCEVDLREGGSYRFVWRAADGQEMGMGGTYREVARPGRLVATERFDGDESGHVTVDTTTFEEKDGRTTVTTTTVYGSPEIRDAAVKSGMAEGVAASYDRLAGILAA